MAVHFAKSRSGRHCSAGRIDRGERLADILSRSEDSQRSYRGETSHGEEAVKVGAVPMVVGRTRYTGIILIAITEVGGGGALLHPRSIGCFSTGGALWGGREKNLLREGVTRK